MRKTLRKLPSLRSLRVREYRTFLSGFFVSQMGMQMQMVAINWQMYELTQSAVMLGLVGVASFIPMMFLSPVGGIAADRADRKKLLIGTHMALAILSLTLALGTVGDLVSPLVIFVFIALMYSAMAFWGPVRQSIIPDLVSRHDLLNAISLNTLTRQIAVVVGPTIAGFLIALAGVASVYVFTALALTAAIFSLVPLRVAPHPESYRASFTLGSIIEGLQFVRRSKIILATTLLDFFASFFGSATSLLPIFAADILGVGARGLGFLYAATAAGASIAGIILSSVKRLRHHGAAILGAILLFGVATVGFGLSRSFALSLFFLALVGAGDTVSTILRNMIRQVRTPAHMRGRVVGINVLFAHGGPKLGDAEAGFVAAALSAPASVVIGGVGAIIATAVIAFVVPAIRNYKDETVIA